jgi:hypothetical protein
MYKYVYFSDTVQNHLDNLTPFKRRLNRLNGKQRVTDFHLGRSEKRRNPRITPYIFTAKGKHKRKGIKITHLMKPARYQ